MLEQETPAGVMAARATLIEAEERNKRKGCGKRLVNQIREEAKIKHNTRRGQI